MRKRDIARYIMDALPSSIGPGGALAADQLALLLLIEAEGPLSVGRIAEALGRAQASTSALIDRGERAGRVHRTVDPADERRTLVHLSVRTVRETERSAGARRSEPYVEGGKPRVPPIPAIGPKRRVVEPGLHAGKTDKLECGHLFVITADDRRIARYRFCPECKETSCPTSNT